MRYLAAGADPIHSLHTLATYLAEFGGALAAVMIVVVGFKMLSTAMHGGGKEGGGGAGFREAFQSLGGIFLGLFMIVGAFFIVNILVVVATALQK
jgi:hypothetical protein